MTEQAVRLVGDPVDRVDGPYKVTGSAEYPTDPDLPGMVHAAVVRSTVAAGRITSIDTSAAEAAPGVLAVITHQNCPKIKRGPRTLISSAPPPPLQSDRIDYYGQYVAVVVATTSQQADHAADLVDVEYASEPPLLDLDDPRAKRKANPYFTDLKRGNVAKGLAQADVTVESTYTTAKQTHSPLGLFAAVAAWEGDRLTVHTATQHLSWARDALAKTFSLPKENVRVLAPFVGGGFGAALRPWPHVTLAALAAREVGRPVKLVLTRPQMFTGAGHRPNTVQRLKIGATNDGKLVAIDHEATSTLAVGDALTYAITMGTATGYACPNVSGRDFQVQLNIPNPAHMRAPGEAEANFALESALDDLSYKLGIDPVDLRLRNHSDIHPQTGLNWSSRATRECYEIGAERFGWSQRSPEPRSMRDGRWLVGYGMAEANFIFNQVNCEARATIRRNGSVVIRSAATDIGTGTYTVMTQLAAETLGLDIAQVRMELGDTDLPQSGEAGGSGLTGGLGTAVQDACHQLLEALLNTARKHRDSPLYGCSADDVVAVKGHLQRADDPSRSEAFSDILARAELIELSAEGDSSRPKAMMGVILGSMAVSRLGRVGGAMVRASRATAPAGAFATRFVEVRVDPELGLLRVARVTSVVDAGRVLNEKLARSQIIGGTVGGIGQTLFEETIVDADTGRIANGTFGDYLIPVNADVPDMDVVFVGDPESSNPIGTKGIGEIGTLGVAAAIANAVYHATGKRITSLPITMEQLML